MKNKLSLLVILACALSAFPLSAAVQYVAGPVTGPLGPVAQIQVPEGCYFIQQSDMWEFTGNYGTLPNPKNYLGALDKSGSYTARFQYEEIGYLKDPDKEPLDAAQMVESLLKDGYAMGKGVTVLQANKLEFSEWILQPRYLPKQHRLEWAYRIKAKGGEAERYQAVILGRRGVMRVTLFPMVTDITKILEDFENALQGFEFHPGFRYEDHAAGDPPATGGLAPLVMEGVEKEVVIQPTPTAVPIPTAPAGYTIQEVAKANQFGYWHNGLEYDPPLTDTQKKMLEAGLQWVSQNLKCEKIEGDQSPFIWSKTYHPVMDRCHDLEGVCFGHFEDNQTLGMVLQVSGGGDLGAHGAYYQDAKYVYIHPSEKGYAGEKFYQYNRGSGMDLVAMPQGPDFIRVSDSEGAPCDCDYGYGPPPSHLFQVIGGKMKMVLSYHHNEEHPHDNYYFQSRLIPFKNRDFRVVSRETRRDWYSTVDNSRIITLVTADFYHWDPAAQEYKSVGKTKPLTLFDWDQATQPGTADTGQ